MRTLLVGGLGLIFLASVAADQQEDGLDVIYHRRVPEGADEP